MQAQMEQLRGQYDELEQQYSAAAPTRTVRVLTNAGLGPAEE
jgi:hypothetical protein